MKYVNTSFIPYEIREKQWKMQRRIKEELKNPNFLDSYTRKTLCEIMRTLFPYETMINCANRAFMGMTKQRMYRHLLGYAILRGWKMNSLEQITEREINYKKAFLVSWYASGYCGTFRYMVVANNLDEAKEIWNKFVENNKDIEYSWRKAEKGVKNHYGGYITWDDKGNSDKEIGCYKMEFDAWNMASDHLND